MFRLFGSHFVPLDHVSLLWSGFAVQGWLWPGFTVQGSSLWADSRVYGGLGPVTVVTWWLQGNPWGFRFRAFSWAPAVDDIYPALPMRRSIDHNIP